MKNMQYTSSTDFQPHENGMTDFGFKTIEKDKKKDLVYDVFKSVAGKYDIMNDLMSLGIHRIWKKIFITKLMPSPSETLLDLAGGTGDITFEWLRKKGGPVILSDINLSMLEVGKKRAINNTFINKLDICCLSAEALPFEDNSFNKVSIAFGLRNCTNKDKVIQEAYRVLKPGGGFFCLEFSHLNLAFLRKLYDLWSFHVLPKIGHIVAKDAASYQYLVESIRMFPDQQTLASMLEKSGFEHVNWMNLSSGIAAIHSGWKI